MLNKLTKDRPLVVYDVETTGLDQNKDQIVQLSILRIHQGKSTKHNWYFNPSCEISKEAIKTHGLTKEFLSDKPSFKQKATEIFHLMVGSVWCGYNSDFFDERILTNHMMSCDYDISPCARIDVYKMVKNFYKHSLTNMYKILTGKEPVGAHDSSNDVQMTIELMVNLMDNFSVIQNYDSLGECCGYNDPLFVDLDGKLTKNEDGIVCFNFGKFKGKPVSENVKYCDWVLLQDTFSNDTKQKIREEIGPF